MPRVLALFVAGMLGPALPRAEAALPERAGIPVAYAGKERGTIVAYQDDDPIAMIGGARRQIHRAPISVIPGGVFGPGFVTVTKSEAVAVSAPSWSTSANSTGNYTAFYATMTADRNIPDVVLILLTFDSSPDGNYSEIPRVALLGVSLGLLKAGTKKDISAYFPPRDSKKPWRWAALLFSGGSQIRTSSGNGVLDALFDMMDRVGLRKAIAGRASGEHPVAVYRHFPLKFNDAEKGKYAGQTVTLEITITPEGLFDTVRTVGIRDQALANHLATQMSSWLFLPPVKDGVARSTTFELPIQM